MQRERPYIVDANHTKLSKAPNRAALYERN
jgi:hypothetical protein